MNLQIEERGRVVLLVVQEERLDAHNSGELKAQMARLFEEGKNNLIIDLQGVKFVDSSGLGAAARSIGRWIWTPARECYTRRWLRRRARQRIGRRRQLSPARRPQQTLTSFAGLEVSLSGHTFKLRRG